ncbi:MAG: Ig-like domain-containing protein, partial [Planctomycetaceae bacterium]|nr:Ig-like domain-containing protein [Planctomycetaceae bacterium]
MNMPVSSSVGISRLHSLWHAVTCLPLARPAVRLAAGAQRLSIVTAAGVLLSGLSAAVVAAEPQTVEPASPAAAAPVVQTAGIVVRPASVELDGNFSRAQLLVTAEADPAAITARSIDLTGTAVWASSDEKIVTVSSTGELLAIADGEATITVTAAGHTRTVPVVVQNVVAEPTVSYDQTVQPILSRHGCNMGACHSSQYGKGGFKLSVFSFQPSQDHEAIVRDRQQRRINFLEPENSLLLRKPTMEVPHGGSRRLRKGSVDYNALVSWITAGAPGPSSKSPKVVGIEVTPSERVAVPGETQQLQVIARYSDDTRRDVTALARYDSMDEALLSVSELGLVKVLGRGQAPVMVRFEDHAEICTFALPYSDSIPLEGWQNQNFVDELASAKFRELGIEPSPVCDDATFIRRAFLDATGTLPTPEEVTAFLES